MIYSYVVLYQIQLLFAQQNHSAVMPMSQPQYAQLTGAEGDESRKVQSPNLRSQLLVPRRGTPPMSALATARPIVESNSPRNKQINNFCHSHSHI